VVINELLEWGMYLESFNDKAEVARLFSEVTRIIKAGMRKSYEDVGITLPQSLVIGTLMNIGEMKITELSRELNLSNSTISGIVDRLEKQQLVVRKRSEKDRRMVYVQLTPKFKEVFQGIYKKAEEYFVDLLDSAGSEELVKVIEGLNVLKNTLIKQQEGCCYVKTV